MGFAKLNIWYRDIQGRTVENKGSEPAWDWIGIWRAGEYKQGTGVSPGDGAMQIIRPLPVGLVHVEVEIPPGAYIVQGHFCDINRESRETRNLGNDYTDRAMVIANCDQNICVNLIVPEFKDCVRATLAAIYTAVGRDDRLRQHLEVVMPTLLQAAGIPTLEALRAADRHLAVAREVGSEIRIADTERFIEAITRPREAILG